MANTQYTLHLKGFVGGADFDRNYVDYVLAQHVGKPVNVLIDSLGGSVATALSIASAFRNHADVSVHFVGMNASAATIASLGAKLSPSRKLIWSWKLCFHYKQEIVNRV